MDWGEREQNSIIGVLSLYLYRTVQQCTVRKTHLLLPDSLRVRIICFIDSEQYFAYHTSYDRCTNHASVRFLLLIWCCGAYSRPICVLVNFFRVIFLKFSTSIRNSPPTFFQNTCTILVRKFLFVFFSHSKRICNDLFRINRGTAIMYTLQ